MIKSHNFPFRKKVRILLLALSFYPILLFSQAEDYVVINDIIISGNKWTKSYIITKELDFARGDSLEQHTLSTRFEESRNRLLNTGLFNRVIISISNWDLNSKEADIKVDLIENWFWYPSPIVELADRSFNEWIYQHNASLKRLNLGVRFMHINLSGNRDKLKFNFNTGFTQKYELDYTFPYLNRNKNLGAYFNIMYVTHKEIPFETKGNQLNFVRKDKEDLLTRFRTSFGLNYRKNKAFYHSILLEYHQKKVHDTISSQLNPLYFIDGQNSIRHLRMNYHLVYTSVDKKIYPRSGYRYLLDFKKDGGLINKELNFLQIIAAYERHHKIHPLYSVGAKFKLRKTLNFGNNIPYSYLSGLGYYDDIVSGYQLYVLDGVDFAYIKSYQKIKLLDLNYDLKRFMPLRQFKVFDLQLYLGIHADIGYAKEKQFGELNPFNNSLIYGSGLSLDIILYQNYFFSCEVTINHLGERGFFLQGTNTFQ